MKGFAYFINALAIVSILGNTGSSSEPLPSGYQIPGGPMSVVEKYCPVTQARGQYIRPAITAGPSI